MKWGFAVIWVISLRGLGRRLRAAAKPLAFLVVITIILWLIFSGWPRINQREAEPPILPEELLPSTCRPLNQPQEPLAASLFVSGSENPGRSGSR